MGYKNSMNLLNLQVNYWAHGYMGIFKQILKQSASRKGPDFFWVRDELFIFQAVQ